VSSRLPAFERSLRQGALLAPGTDPHFVPEYLLQSYYYQHLSEQESGSGNSEKQARHPRRPLHDLGHALKTFASDAGYIYSSPVRINARSLMWAGGIVAVGVIIYAFDQEIHDEFKRTKERSLYRPIRDLGEELSTVGLMGKTNKYFLGGVLLGYLTGIDPITDISAQILEGQFIAGGYKDAANFLVGRQRPEAGVGPYVYKINDGTSFPSGHAKNVFIMARVVSHHIPFLPVQIGAYTVAGAVSLERITSDSHWPSDVYAAAVYGWIVANELIKRRESGSLSIAAGTVGSSHTPGVNVAFHF
jgi:membrane-associated phospholipid phosphatase